MNKHKPYFEKNNMYERLTTVSIEEVFHAIKHNKDLVFDGRAMQYSVRILTYFVHGTDCICQGCTVKGAFFAVERQVNHKTGLPFCKPYHLNFYGFDDDGNDYQQPQITQTNPDYWVDYNKIKEYNNRIDNGFKLFGKYYRNLWD